MSSPTFFRRWAARTGVGGCGRCAPARGNNAHFGLPRAPGQPIG
jgi:hypothetical protein